ncbi:hypothetical protein CBR_g54032 [Chara braunii]|uniref:Uncharacterized protein n=1 Tax=Chara braunii TaxID=69332 RepID=A0A388MBJ3_CHABU|nr:hypothetical protein CBR_g54032 [Chara braunii]|eukprot:GBG91937.1 hypothetical protein CBR_g54032 [Chara braunii]
MADAQIGGDVLAHMAMVGRGRGRRGRGTQEHFDVPLRRGGAIRNRPGRQRIAGAGGNAGLQAGGVKDADDIRAMWSEPARYVEEAVRFVGPEDRVDEFLQLLVGNPHLNVKRNQYTGYVGFAHLCGYGARQRLPDTFKTAMRMRWPNPPNEPYVYFVPNPQSPLENSEPR